MYLHYWDLSICRIYPQTFIGILFNTFSYYYHCMFSYNLISNFLCIIIIVDAIFINSNNIIINVVWPQRQLLNQNIDKHIQINHTVPGRTVCHDRQMAQKQDRECPILWLPTRPHEGSVQSSELPLRNAHRPRRKLRPQDWKWKVERNDWGNPERGEHLYLLLLRHFTPATITSIYIIAFFYTCPLMKLSTITEISMFSRYIKLTAQMDY